MIKKFVFFAIVSVTFSSVIYSQDGVLDSSFDSDGIVITAHDSSSVTNDICLQSDGKIISAGYRYYNGFQDVLVLRYNSNGSLDPAFGTGGTVMTAVGSKADVAESIAIQADGKIVVAGYSNNGTNDEFMVLRYNTDGSLDASFDSDGKVTTAVGSSFSRAYSVAIQGDGKIVVCGKCVVGGVNNFAVLRYNPNGSLDASFDSDGIVTTAAGIYDSWADGVRVQTDGRILVAGRSYGPPDRIALLRYNTDGSLDVSFDSDGIVITPVSDASASSLALQSDGKIVVAGTDYAGGFDANFAVCRYNTNGSLDVTFNSTGIATTDIGGYGDNASDVAIQGDGRIVVFGSDSSKFAVVRYREDGSLDNTFGTGGIVTTVIEDGCWGSAVEIQADSKIVVTGWSYNGSQYNVALARYKAVNNASILENNPEIYFYPNPSDGILFVNTGDQSVMLQIFDESGRLILQKDGIKGASELDLSALAKGTYFLSYTNDTGSYTRQVILR